MAEQNFICTDRCYIVHLTSSLLIGCCCCCCCCSVSKLCLTICDPMTAACQAPLSFTISQSLLRFMSIESVMLPNCLIFCHPLLLLPQSIPASGHFPMSQLFASGGQSIGALASVLPGNIQDYFLSD